MNDKPKVYSTCVEIDQSCQGEDDHLVSFGGSTSGYTYPDGSTPEARILFNKHLWEAAGRPHSIVVAWSADDKFLQPAEDGTGITPMTIAPGVALEMIPAGAASPFIAHDAPPDQEHWYRIQNMHVWYLILACCRSCATRKLHAWVDEFGEVKTQTSPPWLVKE